MKISRSTNALLILLLACSCAQAATLTFSNGATAAQVSAAPAGTDKDHLQHIHYNGLIITGPVTVKSYQQWHGKVQFETATNQFAGVGNNVTGFIADGCEISANCGVFDLRGKTTNVRITNNTFQWGYNGTYYNRHVVRSYSSDGLVIDNNLFRESPKSDRNIDIQYATNHSYSHNRTINTNDLGHWDGLCKNVKIVGNLSTGLSRMAGEFQDQWTTDANHDDNILIEGNVSYDFRKAFGDSFVGGSWMPQRGTNVVIRNNYAWCIAPPRDGWGQLWGGAYRYGIGIEAGFTTGIVEGNTVIGPAMSAVSVSMANTQLKNNKSYGAKGWGHYIGEPGLRGYGSVKDLGGNLIDLNLSHAPTPPNIQAGPNTSQPAPLPPAFLSATGWHDYVELGWKLADGSQGYDVYRRTKNGGDALKVVAHVTQAPRPDGWVVWNDRGFTADQIASKWEWVYVVESTANKQRTPPAPAQIGVD